MEREVRDEMIFAGRQTRETNASNADEARFLGNDLDVAEGAQDVEESPGQVENGWIGAGEERLEREVSARMPQVPGDQARTAPGAGPHRPLRAWHARSLTKRSSGIATGVFQNGTKPRFLGV